MDLRYEAFCFADPLFFDEQRDTGRTEDTFDLRLPPVPSNWISADHGEWRVHYPPDIIMPAQGWKIHVSTTLDTALQLLMTIHSYCINAGIAFKYLRGSNLLLIRNSKYSERTGSGKFITIYPVDEKMFHKVLDELSKKLEGAPGPYILSDLRYSNAPLYVRYGGFTQRWVEHRGTRVLAIAKPDGTLVPDRREPTFSTPDWISIPEFLKPQLAARKAGDPAQFPYRVHKPLHFSNGGGVYLATRNNDGTQVVLKEARPHAGLDRDGTDAITRLHRERDTLRRLADIPGVPQVYEHFSVWEHEFLAMTHLPGIPLGRWLGLNYPLVRQDRPPAELAAYTERALAILDKVAELLDQVHQRGLVFGDLHGHNILLDTGDGPENDDTVSLVDFELAFPATEAASPALGAPGFRAPADRAGLAIDDYALAALRLWMFLPLNTILELAPAKTDALVTFVERRFPVPDGFGDAIRTQLAPRTRQPVPAVTCPAGQLDKPEPDWGVVRKSIGEAILASATPHRLDRLFPGDIEQFLLGGSGFGFGAAGVLYALDVAGLGRYPEHERWLLDSVRRDPPNRPGFIDGAHGIGYVLERFGHRDAASELLDAAAGLVEQTIDYDLHGGLAGIALTKLYLAQQRGDDDWLCGAVALGERLAEALANAAPPSMDKGRAGLLHGWSGPAVLFTRLFDQTGQQHWLKLADRALTRDLDEVIEANDGSLQVRDGTARTLPYLGVGSAGIVMAAELLAERAATTPGTNTEFTSLASLPGLRQACHGEFTVYAGLTYGRAGLLAALALSQRRDPNQGTADAIEVHLRGLGLHAVPYRGQTAFAGNLLLRLSMDVNTGSAGVLLALAAAQDGHGTALPFLEPPAGASPHELTDQS